MILVFQEGPTVGHKSIILESAALPVNISMAITQTEDKSNASHLNQR